MEPIWFLWSKGEIFPCRPRAPCPSPTRRAGWMRHASVILHCRKLFYAPRMPCAPHLLPMRRAAYLQLNSASHILFHSSTTCLGFHWCFWHTNGLFKHHGYLICPMTWFLISNNSFCDVWTLWHFEILNVNSDFLVSFEFGADDESFGYSLQGWLAHLAKDDQGCAWGFWQLKNLENMHGNLLQRTKWRFSSKQSFEEKSWIKDCDDEICDENLFLNFLHAPAGIIGHFADWIDKP